MDLQYVVQLDVSSAREQVDIRSELFEAIGKWLSEKTSLSFGQEFYLEPFSFPVQVASNATSPADGNLSWETVFTTEYVATRIELRQAIAGISANFVTSITVAQGQDHKMKLRIALGRESESEILSPIEFAKLYPPFVLTNLLRNKKLKFSALGQVVDTEFVTVKTDREMSFFTESLRGRRLLPILVVDTVNAEKRHFAKRAVHPLAGMAHVICLPANKFIQKLNAEFPEYELPFSGARLIWPDNEARHNIFTAVNLLDEVRVVDQLKAMLYRASAVVRSRDKIWADANQALRAYEANKTIAEFHEQIAKADASGDTEQKILLLEANLQLRESYIKQLESEYFDISDTQEENLSKIRALEAQLSYFKDVALKRPENVKVTFEDLLKSKSDDFETLFNELEVLTGGAIVFTPNARSQWNKDKRPEHAKMRKALVAFAQSALEWRRKDSKIGQDLSLWLEERLGLAVPFSDAGLVKADRHLFDFEGQTWDRSRHIKLKDRTSPDGVGRVYFDIDKEQGRFIVDHVGLKLYGI